MGLRGPAERARKVLRALVVMGAAGVGIALAAGTAQASGGPVITITAPPSPSTNPSPTFTVTWDSTAVTVTCSLTGPNAYVYTPASCASVTPPSPLTTDGVYTLTVNATNASNVTSTATATYQLETQPPSLTASVSPASPSNNRSPTFTVTVGSTTTSLTCTLTGPSGYSLTPTSCATVTPPSPLAVDGTYTLSAKATDGAGNSSTTTVTYVLDTVAPTLTTAVAPAALSNDRTPTFSSTSSDPVGLTSVTCTVTGPGGYSVTPGSCGSFTPASLTTDGTYTFTVTAVDTAGNSTTSSVTYTLDTVPPTVTTAVAPAALSNDRTPTFSSTTSDPVGVTSVSCTVTGPGGYSVTPGSCGSFTPASLTTDGTYTFTVTALDTAGNSATSSVGYTLDTVPPTVTTAVAPAALSNDRTPTFSSTISDPVGSTVTCTVTGPGGYTQTPASCASCTPASLTTDGTYSFTVTAVDTAGNSATSSVTYTLDTVAPTVTASVAPAALSNDRTPTFTVTVVDSVGSTLTCTLAGPGAYAQTPTNCGSFTPASLTTDGTYTFTVTAVDAAGNSATSSVTYTLDTVAPTVTTAVTPGALSNTRSPTFSSSATDPVGLNSVTCTLAGPGGYAQTPASCGSFTPASLTTDGTYTFTVTAVDAAGNSATSSVTYTLDTVPPTVTTAVAPGALSNNRTPTFSSTSSDPVGLTSVTCTLIGPGAYAQTPNNCGSFTPASLTTDGTYTFTVTAVDAAGNQTISAVIYTLDTVLPVVSTSVAPRQLANDRTPTFTATVTDSIEFTLTCSLTGPGGYLLAPASCLSVAPATLTTDGAYTFTVTAVDPAGNQTVSSITYTLDTVPPPAPTVISPVSPSNVLTPQFIFNDVPGATFVCTLTRFFLPVSGPAPCPVNGVFDLTGQQDGDFELTVYAISPAGNVGPSTTVVYSLDTVPPAPPHLIGPTSPSPLRNPQWSWVNVPDTAGATTATCELTGPNGAILVGPLPCTSPFTGDLTHAMPGVYTLTVWLTDVAGNVSPPATSTYDLDPNALIPPTVTVPVSPTSNRHPSWILVQPAGSTLICTLTGPGGYKVGPGPCPAGGTYDLVGRPDGTYVLTVVARYPTGVESASSATSYVLDTTAPPSPVLLYASPSPSGSTTPFWGFALPPNSTGRCELLGGAGVISGWQPCRGAVSYNLGNRPDGTYTLLVVAVDSAGNASRPLSAAYQLDRFGGPTVQPSRPGGTPTGSGNGSGAQGPAPTPPGPPAAGFAHRIAAFGGGPAILSGGGSGPAVRVVAVKPPPVISPGFASLPPGVRQVVQGVVSAVGRNQDHGTFPLALIGVVLVFLLVQNRIDRRDPKLALAAVSADDDMEFRPPPPGAPA